VTQEHRITEDVSATASKAANSRLPLTFDALPLREKVAIRSAVRAINFVSVAKSATGIDAEAFKNRALRAGGRNYLYLNLVESAQRIGWTEATRAEEIQARYEVLFRQAAVEMHAVLTALVREGRLPERGGLFNGLAATFMSDVVPAWSVHLTESGNAELEMQLRFKSALGLIAYVILRLSEISAQKPALLICDECNQFKIIESTGGDVITRFCSKACRNRFNVREHRRRQSGTARKKSSRKLK
jgi:hypothetical protein